LKEALAFRGGTALYKLHLKPPARYSEDIDLVQVSAEPAGPIMDAIRDILNPWLEAHNYKQSHGRVTLNYRFQSEDVPSLPLRLKVEINTREHFSVFGFNDIPFVVASSWFNGSCNIKTYDLDELLGTKLRALFQRRKGRDLFDLGIALGNPAANSDRIVEAFLAYMEYGGFKVTKRQFSENLANKLQNKLFVSDIGPLLADGFEWDFEKMADLINRLLIEKLPG
jgi:predicted nucleotidyltransferase component of viral defense system